MEVILLERVEKLGQMGDVVSVKPGYARNYLLPQRKALRATEENRSYFDERQAQLEADNLEHRREAERVAESLQDISVVIVRQASDNDHLYGSVTTRDIAETVCDAGVTIDRRQVRLDRPIKTVGLHPVGIRLHPEVSVDLTANVARSAEEAEMRARGIDVRVGDDAEDDEDDGHAETVFDDGNAVDVPDPALPPDSPPSADAPSDDPPAGEDVREDA